MKPQVYDILIGLCLALTVLISCNDETTPPTAEEQYLAKLDGTWTLTDARVDDLLVTSAFSGLALTLRGDHYEVTNAMPPIWPNGGTITLQPAQGAQPFALRRSDDVVMTVTELTATTLVLKYQYAARNARLNSMSGAYEFRFTK